MNWQRTGRFVTPDAPGPLKSPPRVRLRRRGCWSNMESDWKKAGVAVRDHVPKHPIRSSAAEYVAFAAATGNGAESMEMRYEDENIWLTQKMMAALCDVSVAAVNQLL